MSDIPRRVPPTAQRPWGLAGRSSLRERAWTAGGPRPDDFYDVVPDGLGETPWEEREDWEWAERAPVRRTAVALQEWGSGQDPTMDFDVTTWDSLAPPSDPPPTRPTIPDSVRAAARAAHGRRVAKLARATPTTSPTALESIWGEAAAVEDEPRPKAADELTDDPRLACDADRWRAPNRYPGDCLICGLTVPAGAGRFRRAEGAGWEVAHLENDLGCRRATEGYAMFLQTWAWGAT